MSVPVALPEFHYADCVRQIEEVLPRSNAWGVSEAVDRLRETMLREASHRALDAEFVAWVRRDVPELRGASDYRSPRELYQSVAERCEGEAMFLAGRNGALRMGYGDLLSGIESWIVDRFVGLGCPWLPGLPEPGMRTLDLGSGAGLDLGIADRATGGKSVGVDRLDCLAAQRRQTQRLVVLADARQCPFKENSFELVVANGLPPLLGVTSSSAVLTEVSRLLNDDGELRFVSLCVGPDDDLETADPQTLLDALRCSKPHCGQYRRALEAHGFERVEITELPSPFVEGYRPGPVRCVLLRAWKA